MIPLPSPPPYREKLQDNKSGTVNLRGHRQLNGRRIIVGGGRVTRARPNAELINNVVKIHLPRRIAPLVTSLPSHLSL